MSDRDINRRRALTVIGGGAAAGTALVPVSARAASAAGPPARSPLAGGPRLTLPTSSPDLAFQVIRVEDMLYLGFEFYNAKPAVVGDQTRIVVADRSKAAFDFHRAYALLQRHPALLRLFGFVVDLEVERPPGLAPTVGLSVTPQWSPRLGAANTTNVTPVTMTTSASWRATPRPGDPAIADGLLRLSTPVPTRCWRWTSTAR